MPNMIKKIINMVKKIFNKNAQTIRLPEEKKTQQKDFQQKIIFDTKIFQIQDQYQKGIIQEKDLSIKQILELSKIYEDKIQKLTQSINAKKSKLNM